MASRYQILRPLGEGGMGRVFLAEDRKAGRKVALKFLPEGSDPKMVRALKDEVALLARLSHPSLVAIYDYEDGNDRIAGAPEGPFFSMEYIAGKPLDLAMSSLSRDQILDLFASLCRGLHSLHAHGILHRDLKPANVMVMPEGRPKLLDFGLADAFHAGERTRTVGTLAYMAPEARAGLYDTRSDLYSLGVVFHEVLKGRKDVPPYFSELLDRLRSPDPAKRPHSALSLIKFLNRHVARPFDLRAEMERLAVLSKPAWIPRAEEKTIKGFLDDWKKAGGTRVVEIAGPAGIGRSRFVDELRWSLKLKGLSFEMVTGETFDAWRHRESSGARVIHLADLHEWPASLLPLLQIEIHRSARRKLPVLFLAEFDSNRLQNPLKAVAFDEIRLEDFSAAQSRALIRGATADFEKPVPDAVVDDIASGSGGRPLLILEQLRSYLVDPGRPFRATKGLEQAAIVRVEELDPASRALFARLVTHPEPAESADLGLTAPSGPDWDLQEKGLAKTAAGQLALAHPALREAYAAALEASEKTEAHRAWLRTLLKRYGDKPVIAPHATLITHHALGCGEDVIAYAWGLEAMDFFAGRGEAARALRLSDELLRRAKDDVQTYTLEAYRAPLFYRLGKFREALDAYDRWYALKPDDGTEVETVKHLLFTGQTLSAWGRDDEAGDRLKSCLVSGDSRAHVRHRPYHARAHIVLATLDEKSGRTESAKKHLQAAVPLAEGQPLLLAEIEQKLGRMAQDGNRLEEAFQHLEISRAECRKAANPQVEAIAVNVMAMIERERGRLKRALETIDEAISLAEKGGELLQIARYRQNRALIRMNLALYGPALEEMEDVQDVFEALGEDQDRRQARLHREELSRLLGETERTEKDQPFVSEEGRRIARTLSESRNQDVSESDLAGLLDDINGLEAPEERIRLLEDAAKELAGRGWNGLALLFRQAAAADLKTIHDNLPEDLQMDFEKKRDVKTLDAALSGFFKTKSENGRSIPESRFRQFCEINRKIALQNDLKKILEEVIDAAIQISGAERGFVLLKNAKAKTGPVGGFEVKTARHLNQKAVEGADFELSLSLIKLCIDKGTYLLTDDASADPRFAEKKSVADYRLRSVLVLPLEQEGAVFGVIYLDHRYQPDCFSEEELILLRALASQASLSIQKARMIEELTASRDHLAGQVKEQETKIETLSEALSQKRENLRYGYEEIIGRSPPMMKVFQLLDHVTATTIPVWIHGESGTGKELIARSLHFNSPRKNGPFVAENVSAIPETLLESELFGHKKGAFTHADRDRVGLFEQATGGTLFLDEVADMSLAMQAKLLRVLQEGEVRPVGSSKKVKIDVRLVTASNRDLNQLVREGKFRQDLFFRINGLTVELPSLRERKDDLPLLSRHILKRVSKEFNLPPSEMTDRALQILMKHDWPGNVRELESSLRNALLFAKGRPITAEHLNLQPRTTPLPASSSRVAGPVTEEDIAHRQLLVDTLRRHHLDKEGAAKELKVSLRTLYTWMEKHGIPKKKAVLAKHIG